MITAAWSARAGPPLRDLSERCRPHGEEAGTLEWELAIGKYPLFAWAGPGDRITTVGRWIWDCGHPDPDPLGTCSTTMSQQCAVDGDCAAPGCPTCLPGETCVGTVFSSR